VPEKDADLETHVGQIKTAATAAEAAEAAEATAALCLPPSYPPTPRPAPIQTLVTSECIHHAKRPTCHSCLLQQQSAAARIG
jgi:hypothetical protein